MAERDPHTNPAMGDRLRSLKSGTIREVTTVQRTRRVVRFVQIDSRGHPTQQQTTLLAWREWCRNHKAKVLTVGGLPIIPAA